jgi:multicomponent Na+:H+ antiporter subunit D
MNAAEHLPALQVVLPLAAAPLAVLIRHRLTAFLLVLAAIWSAFAISVLLWLQVGDSGPISYAIGNWPPPWGIEYRVDALTALVLMLVSGVAAVVLPYSRASIEHEIASDLHYLFYAMFALCVAGLLGIAITGDAFNLFVFLEISSLSSYVLIALGRDRRALVASYQYLLMGTIGASFIVIGVGLLYLETGTLNMTDMAIRLQGMTSDRAVLAALAFLTVGISLKLALFPLHQWLPNAYAYAPSAVSAFLAATATKVSVYALLRFYFSIFGETAIFQRLPMADFMLLLALAGMFIASTVAIFQQNLKRLFAYSSVAQVGYIVLGISFDSVTGLTATLVHMVNHAVTKGAIFLLLGGVMLSLGGITLTRVQGMGRSMPLTSFGIVLCGLSLIGVPGTAGFVSKWYLILAALEHGQYWLVGAILSSSLLALVYVWRFVEVAYFRAPPPGDEVRREAPLSMLIPAGLLVVATIWFGFDTSLTVGSASDAAQELVRSGR